MVNSPAIAYEDMNVAIEAVDAIWLSPKCREVQTADMRFGRMGDLYLLVDLFFDHHTAIEELACALGTDRLIPMARLRNCGGRKQ